MVKEIHMTFDRLGAPTIEAKGFTDGSCVTVTNDLEKALAGSGQIERTYKPEFYNQADNSEKATIRQW